MIELLASTLRLATPLLLAAQGGILCERIGIATICLEGVMLVAAWTAAVVADFSHSAWLGLFAGLLAGTLAMGIHGLLTIFARADQIVSGVAVNLLAAGITPLFTMALYESSMSTRSLPPSSRFEELALPVLSDIPGVGPVLFSQNPLTYLGVGLPFLLSWILYRTGWGLRALASGDGPDALRTAGVKVWKVRLQSMLLGGAIASLGGIYLSICHASEFTRDMTSGRGYIALAALIFGGWKPIPTMVACLLFGFADAIQIQLQSATINGHEIPVQFIQALPYLVTLMALVGFVRKSRAPLVIGQAVAP